jgi:putative methionine-R-sulfoxide reductase with GAF domain
MTIETEVTSTRAEGKYRVSLEKHIERLTWRNWFLILGVTILTTVGLGTSILTLLSMRARSAWPWDKTDVALLAGLSLVLMIFAGYLTQQQKHLMSLRREIEENREKTSAQVRRHYERLLAVYTVSHTLASETNPQTVFDRIVRICEGTFPCEQVSLMLVDAATHELEVRSAVGHVEPRPIVGSRLPIGEGVAGWVAEHREALLLGPEIDTKQFRDFQPKRVPPKAAMIVPIVLRDELVGVLNVSSRSAISYSQEDLQALLVFAENAGVCIRHTEQTEWMRETNQRLEAALREAEGRKMARVA